MTDRAREYGAYLSVFRPDFTAGTAAVFPACAQVLPFLYRRFFHGFERGVSLPVTVTIPDTGDGE